MGRIDDIHEPDPPVITSLVPSVVAILCDATGPMLMIRRTDQGRRALPRGGHEPGESIAATVTRDVLEETGYVVQVETLDIHPRMRMRMRMRFAHALSHRDEPFIG